MMIVIWFYVYLFLVCLIQKKKHWIVFCFVFLNWIGCCLFVVCCLLYIGYISCSWFDQLIIIIIINLRLKMDILRAKKTNDNKMKIKHWISFCSGQKSIIQCCCLVSLDILFVFQFFLLNFTKIECEMCKKENTFA